MGQFFKNSGIVSQYQAQDPHLVTPVDKGQADTAYGQAQQGLAQQQAFVNALQGQNGIQNQSNVFNQLQGVANGTGPNPAQAMLNQSTGQNVANQAALMAGQRGAGANAGLIARQAAQQGANLQQQAVGQGATMQAQQSLGALNQLGGIAGQQVNNQAGAIQGYNQAAQNEQSNLLNSIQNSNSNQLAQAGMANAAQAANTGAGNKLFGSLIGAGGAALGMAGGGAVPSMPQTRMAAGGGVGPQSTMGQFLSGYSNPVMAAPAPMVANPTSDSTSMDDLKFKSKNGAKKDNGPGQEPSAAQKNVEAASPHEDRATPYAGGGKVPALVSPGEVYLNPQDVRKVEQGKKSPLAGEKIPGKAKVKGDSLKNDTVPKTLEEGGIVLPRSVTEHPHAGWEAKKFIDAIRKKKGSLG